MFIERHRIHLQALHCAAMEVECAFGEATVSQGGTEEVSQWLALRAAVLSAGQSVSGVAASGNVQGSVAATVPTRPKFTRSSALTLCAASKNEITGKLRQCV